jgi:hypothetical protein
MEPVSIEVLLRTLEEKLLQPTIRKSEKNLEDLLADDFLEFGSSGRTFNKEELMKGLANESTIKMQLMDFKTQMLAKDVYLTTYRVLRSNDMKYTLRSSIWKEKEGTWQMFFHQGTPTNH